VKPNREGDALDCTAEVSLGALSSPVLPFSADPATAASGLSVERFAAIRALLDAGQPRAKVLAAHDLDDVRWREQEEQVLTELADAAEQADLEKLRSYQEAYRATWRKVVPAESETETLEVERSALGAALPFKKAEDEHGS
jgi:hypothetical protein